MQRSRRNVSQAEGSVSAKALRWEYFQNREETSWLEGVGASRRVAGSGVGGVGWMDGWMMENGRWMDGWMEDGRKDEWMDGWMDGWMGGWMGGWRMEGWMDG